MRQVLLEPGAIAADLRYCREVLPRVSRTFALNIRLLSGTLGDAVRVGYLLCRTADALEDSWPTGAAGLGERFERLVSALGGEPNAAERLASEAARFANGAADLELVGELPRVLRAYAALPESHRSALATCVTTLARGMAGYAMRAAHRGPHVPYLDTETELDDYCWVVAGCVGVMLTQLQAAEYGEDASPLQRRRLEIAPLVGRALQLTNILLDWPSDVRRGRCYLPASWLAEAGLTPGDLVDREGPQVRALAQRLERKARLALTSVPDYLALIPERRVRFRLFCLWPAFWALESIRHARRDPTFPWGPRRPRLPRQAVFGTALATLWPGIGQTAALHQLRRAATAPVAETVSPPSL